MPFTSASYNSGIFTCSDGSSIGTGRYAITVSGVTVTSGINIDITVRNLTTGNVLPLNWQIPIGWGTSGVDAAPTGVFYASMSFKNMPISTYVDGSRPYHYGAMDFGTGAVGLNVPALVIHRGTRAIGLSTNYPYMHRLQCWIVSGTIYGAIGQAGLQHYDYPGQFQMVNDHFSSGETRSWSIWLRESSGVTVTTGEALSLIRPYTDWFMTNWPDQRPPHISGRILGCLLAQTESIANPRSYNIVSGIYPSSGNVDWNTVLSSYFPSPTAMKARGYNGIMMWAIEGLASGQNFGPCPLDAMPENLKSTLYQINDWSRTNDVKVYPYIGSTYIEFRVSGTWDEKPRKMEKQFNGYVGAEGSGYDLNTAVKYEIDPTGYENALRNINRGMMSYFDGCGFDALADVNLRPYITGLLQNLRDNNPGKLGVGEAFRTPMTQSYIPTAYYPAYKWDGLRCPWLDTVFPNYQNFAIINPSEYGSNTGNVLAEINRCEAAGVVPIVIANYEPFFSVTPSGMISSINTVDKKSQTGRPRGVR